MGFLFPRQEVEKCGFIGLDDSNDDEVPLFDEKAPGGPEVWA